MPRDDTSFGTAAWARRAPRPSRVLVVVLCSMVLSGCFLWTTRGEGDSLGERTDDQERRLTSLEEGIRQERQALTEEVANARTKVAELETVLERATDVVTRNSADLGLEVQSLREQIGVLEGRIAELQNAQQTQVLQFNEQREELEQKIRVFARKAGVDVTLTADEVPADRAEHFAAASRAVDAEDHGQARALLREYVRRYAADERADNAQYLIGSTYLRENRPASAIVEFQRVISDYPRADAADETLFDMAEAYWRLHDCSHARLALEALIRGYAQSSLLARARTRLREIERPPRGYCTG